MVQQTSEQLQETMAMGADFANRTIYLFGHVDEEMSARLTITFRQLDATPGPIRIVLNSSGGSEIDGFAIYDVLSLAQNEVTIDCYGVVQSIAALMLQAAGRRRLSPECRMMIHNGALEVSGSIYQGTFAAVARETEFLTNRYIEIIAFNSNLTISEVRAAAATETYYSAQEAVEAGLADEVIDSENVELQLQARKTKRKRK